MTVIKLAGFTGEIPRTIARLLPDSAAQTVFDARMENGDLRPIRLPRGVFSGAGLPTIAPASIYRFLGDWLFWSSRVNAAPGPVTADRLYYTGDGTPKMYTDTTAYEMAIPGPSVALTATLTGTGSGDIVTRLYVYTNVSEFGEESEPAPLSNSVDWQPGNNVDLSGFSTAMGDRTATLQRIYRSQTSVSGDTTLYFIAERSADTVDYTDNIAPDNFGEPLPSLEWNQPPATMSGLISLPNGMMAAFDGKELLFSEPYIPHAYPEKYRLTTDYEIVALGAYGNTIVVMTRGNPYIVQGTAPENMIMEKLELNLPCINAAGVVDLGYAIAYPSYDGLVVASAGGARLATENLFTRTGWIKLNPATMIAGQHDGRYLASYSYTDRFGKVFSGTIIIDLTGQNPFLVRSSDKGLAFYHDNTTGELFFLDGGAIKEWDAIGSANKVMNWKSKEFVLGRPESMGAIHIETLSQYTPEEEAAIQDEIDAVTARNAVLLAGPSIGGELNGGALNSVPINGDMLEYVITLAEGYITVSVYADKKLVSTISRSNFVDRLPSGFMARTWEVEVSGNIKVTQIALGRTALELRQV